MPWKILAVLALCVVLAPSTWAIEMPNGDHQTVPVQGRDDSPGGILYKERCAQCHDHPTGRIPPRTFLGIVRSPESIIRTLSRGVMKQQAAGLSPDQMREIATYLTGRQPGESPEPDPNANLCAKPGPTIAVGNSGDWNGWSPDLVNSRYQPAPGFTAADLPRLKLKWAFAYPDIAYGQPSIVAGRIYITSRFGTVFSLDAGTGCTYWSFDAGAPVRTAVSIGALPASASARFAAYFGDEKGNVFAIDAETGKALWSVSVEDHPQARITGAPKLYKGRLYVPVSSMEEVGGGTPSYSCCTFRGSVVALDAASGKMLWKSYSIREEPKPTRKNQIGTQMYAPAGGAIWDSPTIDEKRRLIYVGTGDSYTDTPTHSTDAVIAIDLQTGERVWTTQVKKHDDWVVGCFPGVTPGNCPKAPGPDFDFGASPTIHDLPNGKQIILDGAKSGVVYGFDPDAKGKIVWQDKIGEGSNSGSIVWGPAADPVHYYVSIGDVNAKPPYESGGVWAFDPGTGRHAWHTPAPPPVCGWGTVNCTKAQPSGVTAVPGAVFAGSWDGHVRAYDAATGKMVWDFDTGHSFDAVNGVKAKGGAIDMGAIVVGDGMLLVNSGTTPVQHPGNALLVFTVDGK